MQLQNQFITEQKTLKVRKQKPLFEIFKKKTFIRDKNVLKSRECIGITAQAYGECNLIEKMHA